MKKLYLLFCTIVYAITTFGQVPIITTIVDGDCSGGNPKLLEIYANGTVDFSLYALQNQVNANTTWENTLDLSGLGTVTDDFVYITTTGSIAMGANGELSSIESEFPSLASANVITSGTMNLNGDDRVRIISNSSGTTVDQYGVDNTDGTGETWEYTDSYAKRVDGTGPDANFTEINWTIPGVRTLNNLGVCQGGTDTFETLIGGIGTYSAMNSTTPTISVSNTISDLNYFEGNGPSSEGSFTVSGINLTEDIIVTVPTDFEISLTTGTGFGSSVAITPTAGTVETTTIFVRLTIGLTSNSYMGDATASSAGTADQTISLKGIVYPTLTCANVGDIIITEVMQNPAAAGNDPNGEYFELYNTTASPIDIQSWIIKDETSTSEIHEITSSVIVPAMGYALLANRATPNGGITPDYSYDVVILGNGTDGIIIQCGSTIIDQVIWDNGATFPDPTGASMELSINDLNNTANDDGANWAEAVTTFGNGDLGTPGDVNDNASTLSIDSFNEFTNNFAIAPNPTNTGFVNITTKSNTTINISVFDMLGKKVISKTLSDTTLNVSYLNTGIYIVKLDQNGTSVTKKLVIE